jgi:hypothetical protein
MYSLQICGTSGSGKTTAMRSILDKANCRPFLKEGNKVRMYKGELHSPPHMEKYDPIEIMVLGSYETVCGGCDTIPSVKIVADYLYDLSESEDEGLLLFEGLMLSHMVGTVGEAQKTAPGHHWRAFLDTPLNVCLDRVLERRKARGMTKPFNPTNTQKDWPRVRQCRENCARQGIPVRDINHRFANEQLESVIWELVDHGRRN